MIHEIGYGNGVQRVMIPDSLRVFTVKANEIRAELTGEACVREALEHPIGTPRLREIVKPGEKIAIVTSDISRPMPTAEVLPAVLEELAAAGCRFEDVTLVFALGSHRHHTEEERKRLAGDFAYERITCEDSDPDDCVRLGVTKAGTPVDISRTVAEADRRILLGNLEYHYFAGYSGGLKAIMPGCSTPEAIQNDHRMMVDPKACAGNIADNPIRDDIEEGGALCGADFILNVVLDEEKRIVRAVAGDPVKAHREGCGYIDELYGVTVPEKADIVIVSQGGSPKDANLYQTQKALDNSKHVVKDGGIIILAGACTEGFGNKTFEAWMKEAETPDDLIKRVHTGFRLGGHKAAAIGMVLKRAKIFMVSEMPDELVREAFMEPFGSSLQEAFDKALEEKGPGARVVIMPHGGSTLPRIADPLG
ncbi:MAG: nickel-dependent lactate racemase [Clostridia bacterium]|nr:nickel-dependent lactate racemase [Clostridia bacterium]